MEKLVSTPFYEFNPNQLNEVRALSGYKDSKQMNEAIDTLEDWIKKQNHFVVKDFDRHYLENMIINNKGSVERAKQRLDRIFTLRNLVPEVICNFDIENEFENFRKIMHFCVVPKLTKDNYRIVILSFIKQDDSYDVMKMFRYTYLVAQYSIFNDYCAGFEYIFDLREYSFSMFSRLSLSDAHKGITTMMQISSMRIKGIHFIISNKVIDGSVAIVKKYLSDKLAKRIHVHSSFESVCQFIDKSVIPIDFGGEYKKTLKDLSDELFKELCSETNQARIKYLDTAVTIESQRLNSSFNEEYSGMPGSFKSLCVD